MNDVKNESSPREEIHLLDYLLVLAKRSRLIVFASLGITVLTYLYLLLLVPKQYTATARLIPPTESLTLSGQLLKGLGVTALPGGTAGLGGVAAGLLGLENPNEIYVGILNGNTIFDRIIDRFNLRKLYDKKYIEDVRQALGKNAVIEATDDGLITIAVTDKDPKRAAAMANAFAEELDKLLKEMARKDAENQLAFLEKQRGQALISLTKAEDELRTFSERSGIIQLDAQIQRMIAYVATLRAEIDAKEVQIQVLKKQATPFNYDVIRLQTEVNSLKEKLKEAERAVDEACVGDVCLPTSKAPGLGLQYLRLFREVKYQNTLYDTLCKLVELARLDAAKNVSVARIRLVDYATPPEKKSKPQRVFISMIMGSTTFVMLLLGVFFLEFWERLGREEKNSQRLSQIRFYLGQWLAPIQSLLGAVHLCASKSCSCPAGILTKKIKSRVPLSKNMSKLLGFMTMSPSCLADRPKACWLYGQPGKMASLPSDFFSQTWKSRRRAG
ncbi:MAG: hypothetical protein JRI59_02680 [Deltaproteobacteria bacterium]|nr:hypothetical protein [Deltaproteobacteria bacterium]